MAAPRAAMTSQPKQVDWDRVLEACRLRSTWQQRMVFDRQLADTNAGRGEDSVRERGCNRRYARLTCSAERRLAFEDMDLDLRAIAQTQHLVIREVRLHHRTFVDGDGAVECGSPAEHNAAFDLCAQAVRIDGHAAVYG